MIWPPHPSFSVPPYQTLLHIGLADINALVHIGIAHMNALLYIGIAHMNAAVNSPQAAHTIIVCRSLLKQHVFIIKKKIL